MDVLRDKLISDAIALGICQQGQQTMLDAADKAALVAYYLANPDWCLERNFPSLDYLRENFADCEDMGVYIDREFHGELFNDKQVYVFHHCLGSIRVGLNLEKRLIPMLYFGNRCKMRVIGEKIGYNTPTIDVPLYQFGRNDIQARDNRYVKYLRYKEGLKL